MNGYYVNSTTFLVSGDKTSEFVSGRRVKIECGIDGTFYSTVVSSSYSEPSTEVAIEDSVVTSNITTVLYGVVSPGTIGSLPDHSHSSEPGSGGEISVASSLIDLTDTPSSYTDGKYLMSTTSGTVWVTISGTDSYEETDPVFTSSPAATITASGITSWDEAYSWGDHSTVGYLTEVPTQSGTTTSFLDLSDTPTTYEVGKYLRSTASGTEWVTISGTSDGVFLIDGSIPMEGHIIPEMTGASGTVSVRDIGTTTKKFRHGYFHDIFVDAGSLYVNGKKVLEDISDTLTVSTDVDQSLRIKTTGNGTTFVESENEINLYGKGGIETTVPSDSPTKHMNFTNQSAGGNITFTSSGANAQVQFNATDELDFTAPLLDFNGDVIISGDLTIEGQSTTAIKKFIDLDDTPSTYSGTENLYLQSTGSGTQWAEVSSSSVGSFLDLNDTPTSYTAGKYLQTTASGVEAVTIETKLHTESEIIDIMLLYGGF